MENIERLLLDAKESLERQMAAGFSSLEIRFDTHAARPDRHAGLLQTGNRWVARLNDWSEKVDQALEVKDKQIADLQKRVERLEQRG